MKKYSGPDDNSPVFKEYHELASNYDQRWSSYISLSLEETLRRLVFQPGESILDVGCGTGELLSRLFASDPTLLLSGTDPVPEMLKMAKQKLGSTAVLKHGSAESLPFSDRQFDVVISTNAFHYFRNPALALMEMKRVLNKEGRIVITDWCGDYFICRVCNFLSGKFRPAHYRIYGEKKLRALLHQAGFTRVRIDSYKIDWFWGLMTALAIKSDINNSTGEREMSC